MHIFCEVRDAASWGRVRRLWYDRQAGRIERVTTMSELEEHKPKEHEPKEHKPEYIWNAMILTLCILLLGFGGIFMFWTPVLFKEVVEKQGIQIVVIIFTLPVITFLLVFSKRRKYQKRRAYHYWARS
jgi:hypothetical protein